MTVAGRIEVTLKFSEKPEPNFTEDGKVGIEIDCDGKIVKASFKSKAWKKAAAAMDNYPMWVAAVGGKVASMDADGLELEGSGIQVFEKKPKEAKAS